MPLQELQTVVTAEQAGRLDLVVLALTQVPRRQLRGLFARGCVLVNEAVCEQITAAVAAGDRVLVRYDPQQRYREPARAWKDPAFRIVFEDDHLIVVDKAAGFLTVPAGQINTGTLVERVARYLGRGAPGRKAFVVHRLDRHVSGVLVFAKTSHVQRALRDQFEQRKPDRLYLAIVRGHVTRDRGTISTYLATGSDLTRYSTHDESKGELAITHYQVQQRLDDATVLEVQLETGRRNQIRVHLAELGHPVIGDTRYRVREARHRRWHIKRLALHAATLGFDHPVTGQPLTFQAVIPTPLRRFIEQAPASPAPAPGLSRKPAVPAPKGKSAPGKPGPRTPPSTTRPKRQARSRSDSRKR